VVGAINGVRCSWIIWGVKNLRLQFLENFNVWYIGFFEEKKIEKGKEKSALAHEVGLERLHLC